VRSCSVTERLRVVGGSLSDYERLAHYHYREGRPGAVTEIFALKGDSVGARAVGVIVYTMPSPRLELRNVATEDFFVGLDRGTQLGLINKNVRCIGRVIIEPRYRGLGLGSRLVRETMAEVNVPVVEAVAVMGLANSFLERAGMEAFAAKEPARSAELIEAFSLLGIERERLIDARYVQRRLDRLSAVEEEFIEIEFKRFLKSYGRRREMPGGLERTRYVLSKLTLRPVYYIWFNQKLGYRV